MVLTSSRAIADKLKGGLTLSRFEAEYQQSPLSPSNPFNFFNRRVCLTTVDEEWCAFQTEAARVGLDNYIKFLSLPDIGPHQSFNRSTRQILMDFQRGKAETLLFLEDDCIFRDLSHLQAAIDELPCDWDILYLGANLLNGTPQRYSDHLFRVTEAWTTHCVAYSRHQLQFILDNQPDYSAEMYDLYLGRNLAALNAFVVAPMCAYQRPHFSSIWQRNDDYTPIFEASEEKLK